MRRIRGYLSRFLRGFDIPDWLLQMASFASLTASVLTSEVLDIYSARTFSRIAFVFGLFSILPYLVRKIESHVRPVPDYFPERSEYRLPSEFGFVSDHVYKDDRGIHINAADFLAAAQSIIARMAFPWNDPDLHNAAARINSEAFASTAYEGSVEEKLRRNAAICARHPLAFCLLRSPSDEQRFCGLTSVIPLTSLASAAYLTGKISDRDFHAGHVALPGRDTDSVLAFLIAHDASHASAHPGLAFRTVLEMIVASIIQIILIHLVSPQRSNLNVIVAAAGQPICNLSANLLKLESRPEFTQKDGDKIFCGELLIERVEQAKQYVASQMPETMARLAPYLPGASAI